MVRAHRLCVVLLAPAACSVAPDTNGSGGSGSGAETGTTGPADSSTAAAEWGSSGSEGSEGGSVGTTGSIIFDVGGGDDGADPGCGCGTDLEFSYIWVANSAEGTLSKVNTVTMVEEGRYLTREDGQGDPSRTSVSLSGLRASVANRQGGVTTVWALPELCDPMRNGQPGLQTSTGKDDVLPWGEDDCIAWSTPFSYTTQRPLAWMAGTLDPETCEYTNEKLWTSGCTPSGGGNVQAHRLDGATGEVLETVDVVGMPCAGVGGYGGAADRDGNFWISNKPFNSGPASTLARIDASTLEVTTWPMPVTAYGITVDHKGRPWVSAALANNSGLIPDLPGQASAARFDPATETWALAQDRILRGEGGIVEDAQGRMWTTCWLDCDGTGGRGFSWIDGETMAVAPPLKIPEGAGNYPNGISIDVHGKIWVVSLAGGATRYDPGTGDMDVYLGLTNPYTYSDMTGWALQNAHCAPAG